MPGNVATLDDLKQKFLRDHDIADRGHDESGQHRPDPDSTMSRDLDVLLAEAVADVRTELRQMHVGFDGAHRDFGRVVEQLNELLDAVTAEAVTLYQNRLQVIRHGRIQDYEEFDRVRAIVRRLLEERGKPNPFEGPPLI